MSRIIICMPAASIPSHSICKRSEHRHWCLSCCWTEIAAAGFTASDPGWLFYLKRTSHLRLFAVPDGCTRTEKSSRYSLLGALAFRLFSFRRSAKSLSASLSSAAFIHCRGCQTFLTYSQRSRVWLCSTRWLTCCSPDMGWSRAEESQSARAF